MRRCLVFLLFAIFPHSAFAQSENCEIHLLLKSELGRLTLAASTSFLTPQLIERMKTEPVSNVLAGVPGTPDSIALIQALRKSASGQLNDLQLQDLDLIVQSLNSHARSKAKSKAETQAIFAPKLVLDQHIESNHSPKKLQWTLDEGTPHLVILATHGTSFLPPAPKVREENGIRLSIILMSQEWNNFKTMIKKEYGLFFGGYNRSLRALAIQGDSLRYMDVLGQKGIEFLAGWPGVFEPLLATESGLEVIETSSSGTYRLNLGTERRIPIPYTEPKSLAQNGREAWLVARNQMDIQSLVHFDGKNFSEKEVPFEVEDPISYLDQAGNLLLIDSISETRHRIHIRLNNGKSLPVKEVQGRFAEAQIQAGQDDIPAFIILTKGIYHVFELRNGELQETEILSPVDSDSASSFAIVTLPNTERYLALITGNWQRRKIEIYDMKTKSRVFTHPTEYGAKLSAYVSPEDRAYLGVYTLGSANVFLLNRPIGDSVTNSGQSHKE